MRQWTAHRNKMPRFAPGQQVISVIYQDAEGKLCREDRLADEPAPELAAASLGWWRWTVSKRPPTQRELNERLEQLWLSLHESTAAHKEALGWLVWLYLTRKRILRQEGGAFVHVKNGQRMEARSDSVDADQLEAAMAELMSVIS